MKRLVDIFVAAVVLGLLSAVLFLPFVCVSRRSAESHIRSCSRREGR